MKKAIPSIDLSRFILAYFVLVIHFRPFIDISERSDLIISHGLARLAVPFYLICAGYFLHIEKIIPTIKHYIKLYLKWSLAYSPVVIFIYVFNQSSFLEDLLIFIKEFFFQGTVIHLWYLPHSALALFLLFLLKKRFSIQTILLISFILFSVGVFADAYSGWISAKSFFYPIQQTYLDLFITSRNGLFFALFFISLGVYLKDAKVLSLKTSLIGFVLSFSLMICELVFVIYPKNPIDYNYYFALIPTMYFMFHMLLKIELKDQAIYKHLRFMASNIYFSHMLIFYLIMFIFSPLTSSMNHIQRFILITVASTLICGIIEVIKWRKSLN